MHVRPKLSVNLGTWPINCRAANVHTRIKQFAYKGAKAASFSGAGNLKLFIKHRAQHTHEHKTCTARWRGWSITPVAGPFVLAWPQ